MIGLGRVSIGAMALVMLGTSPAFAQGYLRSATTRMKFEHSLESLQCL